MLGGATSGFPTPRLEMIYPWTHPTRLEAHVHINPEYHVGEANQRPGMILEDHEVHDTLGIRLACLSCRLSFRRMVQS